jgi:DNA replication and repair protein RecF
MISFLLLQNFRNYSSAQFKFKENTTFIIGPNSSGKTNILEAIFFLANGKSFRAEKDYQVIKFSEQTARVKGTSDQDTSLEIVIANKNNSRFTPLKRFLVNGVSKRRIDFMGNFQAVLFTPSDLDMITSSPSLRRSFLDNVLQQVDKRYRLATISYSKALRQRNALLDKAKDTGFKNLKQFEYWDQLLIEEGVIITEAREKFITFINETQKEIFNFSIVYDKSVISKARLQQYENEEIAASVTLVGPHRDDLTFLMPDEKDSLHDLKYFGSRGQQRLAILQLKELELLFLEKNNNKRPTFLLDDVFSELDNQHIKHISNVINKQQTIITTTHKEFIPENLLSRVEVIKLKRSENGEI